jgi:enamine deaminase RidA (YjgF/YER057c/UK114 family)
MMKVDTAQLFEEVNPQALGAPRGFTHGLVVQPGCRIVFVAGQTAASPTGEIADSSFVSQFAVSLDKALAVVKAAGGGPEHVVRMTVYVTDMQAYREHRAGLGTVWRERMGRHYPTMSLVAVTELVDRGATVEIEVTAALPTISL